MSDYLTSLAARSLGLASVVEPRPAPLFEPPARGTVWPKAEPALEVETAYEEKPSNEGDLNRPAAPWRTSQLVEPKPLAFSQFQAPLSESPSTPDSRAGFLRQRETPAFEPQPSERKAEQPSLQAEPNRARPTASPASSLAPSLPSTLPPLLPTRAPVQPELNKAKLLPAASDDHAATRSMPNLDEQLRPRSNLPMMQDSMGRPTSLLPEPQPLVTPRVAASSLPQQPMLESIKQSIRIEPIVLGAQASPVHPHVEPAPLPRQPAVEPVEKRTVFERIVPLAQPLPVNLRREELPAQMVHAPKPATLTIEPRVTPAPRVEIITQAEPTPTIQVTIGRIEVRATPPPAKPDKPSRAPTPALSLDEYLRQRANGGRG